MKMRSSLLQPLLLSAALCACASPAVHAQASAAADNLVQPHATRSSSLRLPNVLSNNAVLQRGRPIHIWGWSSPSENITVVFHNQTGKTTADSQGNWELWLAPEPAGGPFTLTVTGSNSEPPITLTSVLVGDVWFASGQSNMEMPLKGINARMPIQNSAQEIADSNHPEIRLLHVPRTASPSPVTDVSATWTACDPTTSPTFSALAYFFARDLQAHLHVPIGIIESSWGGTPISSWMSNSLLTSHADFKPFFTKWTAFQAILARQAIRRAQDKKADAAAIAAGRPLPKHPKYPGPTQVRAWHPSALWNGMVAPITPYTIRGFIWYQGEANANKVFDAHIYNRLFPAMIQHWRARWHEGRLPFLYVQISSYDEPNAHWGEVRNAQRTTLALRGTGMAVTLDKGKHHIIHPPDKQLVAQRLALTAYHISYGEQIEDEGPLFEQVIPQGAQLRIYFTHTAQGLVSKGGPLKGFEIEDGNGKWHYVNAVIQGNTVVVDTTSFPQTPAVRYAWANYTTANLYNGAGLPASTFEAEVP